MTVEPGIYLDGWFGVRIEDDFLVNTDGHEFLTEDLPRDLEWFMIEVDDYEPMDWHNNVSDSDSDESSMMPFPMGGVETIILLSMVAVGFKRNQSLIGLS